MILIVGGTGNVGRHIVPALLARGEAVRVLTRDMERARTVFGSGPDVVGGDLNDPASLAPALTGVDRAYLATNGGDQVLMESNFIAAAHAAGVRHLVKLSLIGARQDTFITLARVHAAIEAQLSASNIPATVLRANYFMENFLASAGTIVGQGAMYGAAGQGRVAFVDGRDIAALAVLALTGDGHAGQTYDVTGPEAITFAEAARKIGVGLDRDVAYVDLPDEAFRGALSGAGMPEELVEIYAQGQRAVQAGEYARVSGTVEALTGRAARTLEAFARDQRAAFERAASTP